MHPNKEVEDMRNPLLGGPRGLTPTWDTVRFVDRDIVDASKEAALDQMLPAGVC